MQGINYWAVEHHKGAWLGAGAGAGEGACLAGWHSGCCPGCDAHDGGVPDLVSPQPRSRGESREVLRGLAKGSPGWASKQLPPWVLREARTPPPHSVFLPLSALRLAALTQVL